MILKKTLLAASLAVLASSTAPATQAAFIAGSMTLAASSANINGASNLASVTTINFNSFGGVNSVQSGAVTGSYGNMPAGTGGNIPFGTAFTTSTLTLGNLGAFSFTNATYGTFQAVASLGNGLNSQIVTQSAGFLDVILYGNYSGLPGKGGDGTAFVSTPTSVEFSFTQAPGSTLVSASGSLNTPPAGPAVPEPASVFMLGLGLIGAGGYAARRRPVK